MQRNTKPRQHASPVNQVGQPGTFEYTLSHVVDNDLDMSLFESRHRNDYNGAPAYDPAIPLKIVLFAYSSGITRGDITCTRG